MQPRRLHAASNRSLQRWRAWALVLCLFGSSLAFALSPDRSISDFRITTWGTKEGAPTTIAALAQTSDGYLWLGSAAGLIRFDGLRFEHIDLPRNDQLSSANIYTLYAPAAGGLWIGFTFGSMAYLNHGELKVYTEKDGLPAGTIRAIAVDLDGTVWVGTTNGLARLQGSRWRRVGAEQGYTATMSTALLVDSAGTLWSMSRNKAFSLPRGAARFREVTVPGAENTGWGIAESPTGEVFVTGMDDDLAVRLARNENPGRHANSSGLTLMFDRDGALWGFKGQLRRIGKPQGLSSWSWSDASREVPSFSEYKVADLQTNLLEDREGNVWFVSPDGLNRLSERSVVPVAPLPDGWNSHTVGLAAGDRGSVWLANRTAGKAFHLSEGRFAARVLPGQVSCITRAEDGTIWFGSRAGLWKVVSDRIERIALPQESESFDVQAMVQDQAGDLWVSIVRKGVFRRFKDQWLPHGGVESLPKIPAVTMTTDARGRLWLGYTEGRVAVLEDGKATLYPDSGRLAVGNVTAIHARRSRVWVGGEFGLAVLDGTRFRTVTPASSNAFNSITGLVETPGGDLWINSRSGIVHLTVEEARRAAEDPGYRPHGELFNAFDGVEGSSARLRPLPTAVEGTDGMLWFLTDRGLYSIDPQRIHRNPVPPPVVIEALTVADQTIVPAGEIQLAPGTTSVRIDYVGLSLTLAEKVRYRYKLDGVDRGWQDAQSRRQAFYPGLSPGRYRFHVTAANNDGVWNETGATLEFFIPPTFVQTGWFVALCILGLSLLVWLTVKVRVQQVSSRMRERFAERLAERERIARELHDTLLQSTQGLILRFQAVTNRFEPHDPACAMLNETLDRADAELAEARNRVLDLRESADPSRGLPDALRAIGDELAKGQLAKFSIVTEGRQRHLQPLVKDEFYRIGREALLNAFRHAKAKTIEVQLIYGDLKFHMRVGDDGVGVDENVIKAGIPGHWGFQGMHERAQRIGGQLDIWSRPGAGTELELTLSAKTAYA